MRWLLRFWPWHDHVYCAQSWDSDGQLALVPIFRCRCGDEISGHDLFRPDSMMGKYWRERYP